MRHKIILHDFVGHPFQAGLSRRLAERGHTVVHAFCSSEPGPKGRLARVEGDPPGLEFWPIETVGPYIKAASPSRIIQERRYAADLARRIAEFQPTIVISGNTPTLVQDKLQRATHQNGAAFVHWCQDIFSLAVKVLISKKNRLLGEAAGSFFIMVEARQAREADHIIIISDAFRDQFKSWGVSNDRMTTIPNWGALEEIPLQPKANAWAREQGLGARPACIYTGTLALKHNPELLIAAAREIDADFVVCAAGAGADALAEAKAGGGLDSLELLPLQPVEQFSEVLGAADVLLAVIESDAGVFSVPSKVQSYLCAGRPIVLAAPQQNLAAAMVRDAGAGIVTDPGDQAGFVAAVRAMLTDPARAQAAGRGGRAYAEQHFDLERVTDRFEALIDNVLTTRKAKSA